MFYHKKYMVRFMVRTILNSLNPELNLRFGSGILVNCELNLWFGSGWFGFEPKFRTELFHHYLVPKAELITSISLALSLSLSLSSFLPLAPPLVGRALDGGFSVVFLL